MRPNHALAISRTVTLAALLALTTAVLQPRAAVAQTDACSLVGAGDVAALLGGTVSHKPSPAGGTCTWSSSHAGHKLLVLTYKLRGMPAEAAYMGARKNAQADSDMKVADETGVGDRAFSGQASFGAVFIVLKKGRMLQLQYWTGKQGTAQDVAALRPVVRKAVAAF